MVESPHGHSKAPELALLSLCSKQPRIETFKRDISSGIMGKSDIISLRLIHGSLILPRFLKEK